MSDKKDFVSGSYTGVTTITKDAASTIKLVPPIESVTVTGLEDGKVRMVRHLIDGDVEVPPDEAQELAREYLSIERLRYARLNMGPNSTMVWKDAKHVTAVHRETVDVPVVIMRCARCSTKEQVALPIRVGEFHALFSAFGRTHEGCTD